MCVFTCTHMRVPRVHRCVFTCAHMCVSVGQVFALQENTWLLSNEHTCVPGAHICECSHMCVHVCEYVCSTRTHMCVPVFQVSRCVFHGNTLVCAR